ncbi:hypothetical protein FPOAC2_10728 [Fusarium poae]
MAHVRDSSIPGASLVSCPSEKCLAITRWSPERYSVCILEIKVSAQKEQEKYAALPIKTIDGCLTIVGRRQLGLLPVLELHLTETGQPVRLFPVANRHTLFGSRSRFVYFH